MELVEKTLLGISTGRKEVPAREQKERRMLMRKATLSCNLLHPWRALAEVKRVARTAWERAVAHSNVIVPGVFPPPSAFSIC